MSDDQVLIDKVCHYRNLAIECGAEPAHMLDGYDRQLCERHRAGEFDHDNPTPIILGEVADIWDENERLAAQLDRYKRALRTIANYDANVTDDAGKPISGRPAVHVAIRSLALLALGEDK